jgi:putative SOS response-associated peptidase YedK
MWERWKDPEGNPVDTVCLLTSEANSVLAPVHDRMPVLLDKAGVKRWLDDSVQDVGKLGDLLVPGPAEAIGGHPVSVAVNSVRNDDPRNIESEAPSAPEAQTDGQQSLF